MTAVVQARGADQVLWPPPRHPAGELGPRPALSSRPRQHAGGRVAILREGRLVELNQVSHLTHLRQQEVAVSFATAHVRQRASVARRRRSEECVVVFITLTTDLGTQSHGVGMMEAVIAEIAPQARVIHYTHGIADYDPTRAARALDTVLVIMPAIHVCVCDPGVGTARRPLAILTHRGDIVIGP